MSQPPGQGSLDPGKTAQDSPEQVGAYRLDALLGRGGMGEVYLAWDERLERHVALKRVLPEPPPDEMARARFRREARAVARLSHPAIVQVFELLETADGDCLVMEYVEGRSLAEHIAAGDLELSSILRLAHEIAEGLGEAHQKGLIHRDLKPENIRVTLNGHAKILDFGLARLLWQDGELGKDPTTALTRSGALLGTVHAMSPEQASGRPVDHRSDLFALGGVLYEMLTGQAPFRGSNLLDTLRRVTSEAPRRIDELCPGLPPGLADLVHRLLAKEPTERIQNAHLVQQALDELLRQGSPLDSPDRTAPQPIRPLRGIPTTPADPRPDDLPTAELERPRAAALETKVGTLLLAQLVEGEAAWASHEHIDAATLRTRHHRLARDLLAQHDGLEIDAGGGFLFLFERPLSALAYALAYHRLMGDLSNEAGVELDARLALHLGEVVLRHNPPEDVSRGARPVELEGQARDLAERVLPLAQRRQTLLTQGVFDLTRRSASEQPGWQRDLRWLAHGAYLIEGIDEPVDLFEVGVVQFSALHPPPDSPWARRTASPSDELMLGWRPAPEQAIPRRPHWELSERLGVGGFGEVWLAAHKSGEQRVFKFCFESSKLRALKREVTLFRLLKEALGHRDDIARILDWNFDAAPYFLEVEHTEGGDLTAWAAARGGLIEIPLDTRLDVVAQVAEALAAAHSVGVLHKDVKPDNILIAPDPSGAPRIRLTDFGIGLLMDREQLAAQGVTALGWTATLTDTDSAAGTRRYLAPELLEGKPATVQADVYSLGVLLYQMVVADVSRVLASGWQREIDDPLLRNDIAALVDGQPERRPRDLAHVAQQLRRLGERRQEQAEIQRQREQEQQARRALAVAQRRRRWASWAAAAIFAALLGVLALAERERRARQAVELAQQETLARQQQAEGLIQFMLGDLHEKLQPVGRLDVLADVGEQALLYFDAVPREDLTTGELGSYAKALHQIGELAQQQGDLDASLRAFEQALQLTQELNRREPDEETWQQDLGEAHFWVGFVAWRRGQLDDALQRFEAYLAVVEDLAGRHPDDPELQLELIHGHSNIASVLEKQGRLDDALQRFLTGLAIGQVMVARDPDNSEYQLELAITHNAIGSVLTTARRLDEAIEHYRREVEIKRQLVDGEPDNHSLREELAIGHNRLGDVLDLAGQGSEARDHLERADGLLGELVDLDPTNLQMQHFLGNNQSRWGIARQRVGDHQAARQLFQRSAEVLQGLVDADPTDTLWQADLVSTLVNLGWSQRHLGHGEAADETAQRILEILQTYFPIDSGSASAESKPSKTAFKRWGKYRSLLGQLAADRGDRKMAQDLWLQALANIEQIESGDWSLAETRAHVLRGLGRLDDAESLVSQWTAKGFALRRLADKSVSVSS